jgi:hypothetical protein
MKREVCAMRIRSAVLGLVVLISMVVGHTAEAGDPPKLLNVDLHEGVLVFPALLDAYRIKIALGKRTQVLVSPAVKADPKTTLRARTVQYQVVVIETEQAYGMYHARGGFPEGAMFLVNFLKQHEKVKPVGNTLKITIHGRTADDLKGVMQDELQKIVDGLSSEAKKNGRPFPEVTFETKKYGPEKPARIVPVPQIIFSPAP